MSDFLILILIVVLFLCLTVTLFGFVIYSGLLHSVEIKTGSPPVRNVTIAYKLKEGPASSQWGPTYAECTSIGPNLSSIGIFYDDPKQKTSEKCRYAVGSVLSEGEEKPDEELLKLYEQYGFKVFSLPEVSHAVTTCFPYTTPVSHVLASFRVYPELQAYIQDRKLCAFPTIEICKADQTYYMVPLSRQTDFFVPEMRDEVKTELKEEDSDEDRGTDITGADSHSDGSSVSGGAPWDSRETSLAASTAASLASSLPLRDLGDGEEDGEHPSSQHREHGGGDRGSDESVGSGSSFEELDMEPVEVPAEEEEEAGGPEEEEEGGERGTEPEGNPAAATTEEDKVIEPLVEPPRAEDIKALGGGEKKEEVEEE